MSDAVPSTEDRVQWLEDHIHDLEARVAELEGNAGNAHTVNWLAAVTIMFAGGAIVALLAFFMYAVSLLPPY